MSNLPGLLFYSDRIVFRLGRHLFIFLSMILIFSWVVYLRVENSESFIVIARGVIVNAVFFFGYAYLTAYVLVPGLLTKKKYLFFIFSFLLSGMIISYLKFLFSDFIFYTAIASESDEHFLHIHFSQALVNTKDMSFIVALFLIAKFTKDNHQIKMRLRDLQENRVLAEIKLLKNQLDPHVVFNNLNNIYSLALNDSPALALNIGRFKSVLGYYFQEGKQKEVELSKELESIENYINLEMLRYGERLKVDFVMEGSPHGKYLSPFLFFSIVENCFEHGCSIDSGKAWIRIFIRMDQDSIQFHASNSKPENVLSSKADYVAGGSQSLRKKLELLYPGKHFLRIDNRGDMYSLDLKLNT